MADHRAENIVVEVVDRLTGLATTGSNIFRGRVHELAEEELPGLCVYQGPDNPRSDGGSSSWMFIDSDLVINVEAIVKDSAAQVETTLNQIRYELTQALQQDVTQGFSYVHNTTESTSSIELNGSGDKIVGRLRMEWVVHYRRRRFIPTLSASGSMDDSNQEVDAAATHTSAFYFDALPNIRDFGVRNLANMRTVAGGGTSPVNNGDTVGEWRGELGNVVLQESSTTWRPKLGAEGVSFQAASGTKRLRSSSGISRSATLAVTVFVIEDLSASGYTDFVSPNMRTTGVIQHGFSDANSGTSVQTACREQSAGVTIPSGSLGSGRHCHAYVFDASACNIWLDSTKTNRPSIGSGTGTSDIFELTNVGAQDGTVVAWGVIYGAISDTDWAKIVALAPSL